MTVHQAQAGIRPPARPPAERVWRVLGAPLDPRTWMATGYLLLSMFFGIAWFAVIITLFLLSIGLAVVWVGVPLFALKIVCLREIARVERAWARTALGADIPDPYRPPERGSLWRRLRGMATDPATWKDFLYVMVLLPLGTLWFSIVTVVWSVAFSLLAVPVWYLWLPGHRASFFEINGHANLVIGTLVEALALGLAGLLLCVVAAWVSRGLGAGHAAIARGLLGPSPQQLARRVEALQASRARTVDAAEAERRRIERDLHDGAQQRLVALAMDLGMAKERLAGDADPEAVRALVAEAHDEAKRALVELRDLARGIHPAVLADRGLDAAISALAARSPVPVEVEVDTERLASPVESIAYFVVAEALTNVAKHARATEVTVRISRERERLLVEIRDNGAGGATVAHGGGLGGLADRVAGIDGRLVVDSPPGGPTVVRAELPCGS
ncbi:MAG TPA: sensor domain-containing protein [Actinomycetota bacterium]